MASSEVTEPAQPSGGHDDLVDLFRRLASTDELAAPTPAGSGLYYVDNEPLDLAAILRPPAVLQAIGPTDPAVAPALPEATAALTTPSPRLEPVLDPPQARTAGTPTEHPEPTQPATRAAPPRSPRGPRALPWPHKIVAGVAVLALMAGTGWFLTRGPLAPSPTPPPSSATPSLTAAKPGTASLPIAPQQAEYAVVLRAVTSATDLTTLSAAADQATTLAAVFARLTGATPAGETLIRAQTSALHALGSLDALTARNIPAQFPALIPTLSTASRAVTRARAALPGNDPGTDTRPATRHVLRLLAPLALSGLTTQVNRLVAQAGAASTTADLRSVAAESFQVRVASEDTAAILGTTTSLGVRAAHLKETAAALAAMKDIDGDRLATWARISTRLTQHLGALNQPTTAVAKVDQMIASATLLLQTWEELHAGPDREAVAAYGATTRAAVKAWSDALATLAAVRPDHAPTPALTHALTRAERALSDALSTLKRISVPEGAPDALPRAHRGLITLATRGRAAASRGREMALATQQCGPTCLIGDSLDWQGFLRARSAVGRPEPALAAWQSAYDGTVAEAAAVPPDSAKPVV